LFYHFGTAGRGQVNGIKAGDLVVLAADTALNTTNIGLVGLMQTGIEYSI